MRNIQFAIIVYISSVCSAHNISEQYKYISSHSSSSTENDIENTDDSWQPMSQRNWIILNTKIKKDSTSAEAPAVAMAPNNYRNNIYSSLRRRFLTTSNTNAYTEAHLKWHTEQQGALHHPKINYYTYNHSTDGNYIAPTAADVKLIEPYVLTISKMRTRSAINPDAVLAPRVSQSAVADASSTFFNTVMLPKDIIGNLVLPQKKDNHKIESSIRSNNGKGKHGGTDDAMTTSAPDENNVKSESVFDKIEADGAHLNEISLSLRHTLDKVIYFCDIARRFISNDEDNDDNDEEEKVNGNDLKINNGPSETQAQGRNISPDGVQVHQNVSSKTAIVSLVASTSTGRSRQTTSKETTTLTSAGTGRKIKKLKKKLSKLILPLLLAYKLKFLTLIPVLIGGLILLVGTTGLAGFFFALFTAVMSLKSTSSSKSIVVKKI